MSPGLVPHLVSAVVVGGVLAGVLVLIEHRRTPEKRRLEGQKWALGFTWIAWVSVPPVVLAYAAVLAALPGLVAVAKGYVATRPDYLVTVMVGIGFLLVSAIRTEWWLGLAALFLVSVAAAVEVTGARFARMPEPAAATT